MFKVEKVTDDQGRVWIQDPPVARFLFQGTLASWLWLLAYFVVMRVFFQRSREADKKVDYSKIRPWKDDED